MTLAVLLLVVALVIWAYVLCVLISSASDLCGRSFHWFTLTFFWFFMQSAALCLAIFNIFKTIKAIE